MADTCDSIVSSCPNHPECKLVVSSSKNRVKGGDTIQITASGANGTPVWGLPTNTKCKLNSNSGNSVTLTTGLETETLNVEAQDNLGCRASVEIVVSTLKIKSTTRVTSPSDRTRLKLGVGEEVTLEAIGDACEWSITSGSGLLTPNSGKLQNVKFMADDKDGSVTILATNDLCSATITFTVVKPLDWTMNKKAGTNVRHNAGIPGTGFWGTIFIHPNDVNFYNIEIRELDSQYVGTGSSVWYNGNYHGGYPPPDRASPWIGMVSGGHTLVNGTEAAGTDNVSTGTYPSHATTHPFAAESSPPFTPGNGYFPITMQWHVVGKSDVTSFGIKRQEDQTLADGTVTISKGGFSASTKYSDPQKDPM